MIEIRYVGVPAVGHTTQVLEKICQVVRSCGQTHAIPLIKVEKKVEKKDRRQFYVFLAVEGVGDHPLSDSILNVLRLAGLTGKHFWPLTPAEIKPMTSSGEVETHDFHSLSYKPLWDRNVGDPYDLSDKLVFETAAENSELTQQHNQLLYWLSATAAGTWETFVKACRALRLAEDSNYARRVFRRLMLLGHIECAKDGSEWSVCPPALVHYPTKSGLGFLSGQRTPKLLRQIEGFGVLTETPQPGGQGPARIEVSYESLTEGILELPSGIALHMTGAVATRLAELLPDLEGWKETLTPLEKLNTANYSIERWDGRQYAPCTDFYQHGDEYVGASGLYRLTRGKEANSYRMVLYFDCDRQKWLKGDWYGLRFLIYRDAGQDYTTAYHSDANELMICAEERWPLLYERAPVLASGLLPQRTNDARWLVYRETSADLAHALTRKLNVTVEEKRHA